MPLRSRSILPERRLSYGDVTKKNPAAVALGRLGGLKGGTARAKRLLPERRVEIARTAAQARWKARTGK